MAPFSPIHHFFAPQADARQWRRAVRILPTVWRYRNGESHDALERSIGDAFHGDAFLFCTGTDAIVAVLKTLDLKPGDEVVVPGYTCFSPGGAVSALGGTVVFADVSPDDLNLTVASVEAALSDTTRAVICQHTFGIPADAKGIRELCDRKGILFIEDCAHSIPDASGPAGMGSCGHAVILSFGRYKAISGMAGGAVICRDKALSAKIAGIQKRSGSIGNFIIFRLMLYPILFPLLRPFIGIGIGTVLLWLIKRLHILPIGSTPYELKWEVGPETYRMPNACAYLALDQWKTLRSINDHRRELVRFYLQEANMRGWRVPSAVVADLPLQKFPLFLGGAERIRRALRKKNIHLYDGCWSRAAITNANVVASSPYLHDDVLRSEQGVQALLLPVHSTMSLPLARRLLSEIAAAQGVPHEEDAHYEDPSYPEINAYAL